MLLILNRSVLNRIVWSFNCVNKWLVFNEIVSDTKQYLEPLKFVESR